MNNLIEVFGGQFVPQSPTPIDKYTQFLNAVTDAGIVPPTDVQFDGKLHRFCSSGKNGNNGWYVLFDGLVSAGSFGCWRLGISQNFKADIGRELSPVESMNCAKRFAEAKAMREAEQSAKHESAAITAQTIWDSRHAASAEHPYLMRKGIAPNGVGIATDGRLICPIYIDAELTSIQYIAADGNKMFLKGGQIGGGWWHLGDLSLDTIYIAEGFATAASIYEATGKPCVIAYSATNLSAVAKSVRALLGPLRSICIVGDNDESGTGEREGKKAADIIDAKFILSPIGDANDYVQSGGDLNLLLNPPIVNNNYLIPADEFCLSQAPIKWMIKDWVQSDALVMVHGPSGGGKTFVVLDWMMRIASDVQTWCSKKVNHGHVVYLAGEGHNGLRGRIAAWKKHHGVPQLNMWISKAGCDLNTPHGYTLAKEAIQSLNIKPTIIVVDTLHRFMYGDENSAQDAKTMLDSCAGLMSEFKCSVLLVHHTGVSEEAQHRARGSSAWRGALDIEVSIVPGDKDKPLEIIQRKSKDTELAKPVFMSILPVELDWIDADGMKVTSAIVIEEDAPVRPQKEKGGVLPAQKRIEAAIMEAPKIVENRVIVDDKAWNNSFEKDENGHVTKAGRKMKHKDKVTLIDSGYLKEEGGVLYYENDAIILIVKSILKDAN